MPPYGTYTTSHEPRIFCRNSTRPAHHLIPESARYNAQGDQLMTENIENLILEHLRTIRAEIVTLTRKVDTLTIRVGSLEEHVAGLRRDLALIHADIAATNQRLDHHEQRLDRIERRLELTT